MRHLRIAYNTHKNSALERGIPFLLSYDEWLKVWQDSGHLTQRGRCLGQYVMARFGDTGPYVIGNVKIITNTENTRERVYTETQRLAMANKRIGKTHSISTKSKIGKAHRGKVITEKHRQQLRAANLGKKASEETRAKMRAAHERCRGKL